MITVTGLESSGTRALHNLVAEMTSEIVSHISWPNAGLEWGPEYVRGQKVIICIRRPDIRNLSAVNAGYVALDKADEQWYNGIATLAGIPGALWIPYEAMIGNAEVQVGNIAAYIGVSMPTHWLQWKDENRKYRQV